MFKRLLNAIGNFVNIADLFCYLIVSLIGCSLWFGYQKAERLATHTRIIQKLKNEDPKANTEANKDRARLSEPEAKLHAGEVKNASSKAPDSSTDDASKSKSVIESSFWNISKYFTYVEVAKDTVESFSLDKAKNTVGSINDTVNRTIQEVAGIQEDPRSHNLKKGNSKRNRAEANKAEVKDSLAPF